MCMFLTLKNILFSYDTSAKPLFEDISVSFSIGWTGVVGENGCGKSTFLQLAARILKPCSGNLSSSSSAIYCSQRTDFPPSELADFLRALDNHACKLKGLLGVREDWFSRWETLSHGERKRIQIAAALWKEPRILAVDEPTNHLDREARDLITASLLTFKGVGLIVSHDRELLDKLCGKCLFIDHPDIKLYVGNYSKCTSQKKNDEETAVAELQAARRNYENLKREIQKRKESAERAERNRSKKHIDKSDHDAKEKIDRYIVSGIDGRAGQLKRQMQGRFQQAQEKMLSIKTKKEYDTGIQLNSKSSGKNCLFRIPEGQLNFGTGKLCYPELEMYAADKIAITGANGTGKSTLIRHITNIVDIPENKLIYIPQEIDIETSKGIIHAIMKLTDDRKARIMSIIRHLGSDPKRILATNIPSPGEVRKLLIAKGILQEPNLIIMDEPTNHLDLISIECVENALRNCACGLLLVSHDYIFLKKLTIQQWHIVKNYETNALSRKFW